MPKYFESDYKATVTIPGWAQDLMDANEATPGAANPIDAWGTVPLLYRAVNIRTSAISSVPYIVYKGDTPVDAWPVAKDHSFEQLVKKIELSLLLCGVAYVLKIKTGFQLTRLQWLNPKTVDWTYVDGRNKYVQKIGDKTYGPWYDDDMMVMREDALNSDTGPGVAPAMVALKAAKIRFNMDAFVTAFFEGGAQPITVISTTGNPKDSEVERTERFFKRTMTGVSNAWRTLFLRGDIKVQPITPDLKSMAMPDQSSRTVLDISAALDVPRSILESDAANYATSQTDITTFWTMTVRPRLPMYEHAFNTQIFGDSKDGYNVQFAPELLDVFQEDEANRAAALLQLVNAGMSLDEAKQRLGYSDEDINPAPEPAIEVVAVETTEQKALQPEQTPEQIERDTWRRYALKRYGKDSRPFKSENIPEGDAVRIQAALDQASSEDDITKAFDLPRPSIKAQPGDIPGIVNVITSDIVDRYLNDIEEKVLVDFGSESLEDVLAEARLGSKDFVINSARTQEFMRSSFGKRIKEIAESTRKEIGESMAEAIRLGEGHGQMTNRIRDKFKGISRARARTIARTEVGTAANFSIDEGYRQSGIVQKRRWVTTFLNSRETHQELNGQERAIGEDFSVSGMATDRPGNFGIAAEDINCRCRLVAASFNIGTN